jgi:VanZ family protein
MQNNAALWERLYTRLGVFKSPAARWVLAAAYTLLVTVLLVQSSSQPIVGPPAPPGTPDLKREIELTLAHIVVFSALVVVWWWALLTVLPTHRAIFVTLSFVLVFGVVTELAQAVVPDRQPSLFDMAVNWTVAIAAGVFLYRVGTNRSSVFQTVTRDNL